MSEMRVEIHYQVPGLPENEDEFEKILAAIGKLEDILLPGEYPTVELSQTSESIVFMALSKIVRGRTHNRQVLRDVEVMQNALESQFDESDRMRLSSRFVGIKIPTGLEVE